MKLLSKIVPLVLSLSLLVACSEEDDEIKTNHSSIDPELVGYWRYTVPDPDFPDSQMIYALSLSANGRYGRFSGNSNSNMKESRTGEWWSEGGYLTLFYFPNGDVNQVVFDVSAPYSINSNTLQFDGNTYKKQ